MARIKPTPALHPLLRDLFRTLALVAACIVLAHLLAGCGGDPEPDVATPQVNCALQPVVCQ
jgi:hypothetical protein